MSSKERLRESEVIAIRNDQRKQEIIAADYGLTQAAISQIKRGLSHQRMGGPIIGDTRRKLTDTQILEAWVFHINGWKLSTIAHHLGVVRGTVTNLLDGTTHSRLTASKTFQIALRERLRDSANKQNAGATSASGN
jgi:transcriptional regulator